MVTILSREYGAQSVVVAIDVRKRGDSWRVYVEGGKREVRLDGVEWARRAEELGAGELLVTSIDADGTGAGYDVNLYMAISEIVNVPIIASGGAGKVEHFAEVLRYVDAALAASVFHMELINIQRLKAYLMEAGIKVRI